MAAPYWVTTAGDLGTIQESEFYTSQLYARDPEENANNTGLTFTLIAGKLPGGIALAVNGLVDGIPTQRSLLKGVPYEVATNITSTFVIRVTDVETLISDRTFSLTVAGPDDPEFSTAAGKLADVHDGHVVNTTIAATDSDLDVLSYSIASGSLPPGLTMSTTGAITGRITKVSSSQDFNFVVRVTDGNTNIDRQFSYRVHAIGNINLKVENTPDTGLDVFGNNIRCDSTFAMWTADNYTFARPYMVKPAGSVGTIRHSNYYIDIFEGKTSEVGLELISFEQSGNLPQGTTFDGVYETNANDGIGSCIIYGTIPSTTASSTTYTFSLRAKNNVTDPGRVPAEIITLYSEWVEYSLTVRGAADTEVTWG